MLLLRHHRLQLKGAVMHPFPPTGSTAKRRIALSASHLSSTGHFPVSEICWPLSPFRLLLLPRSAHGLGKHVGHFTLTRNSSIPRSQLNRMPSRGFAERDS